MPQYSELKQADFFDNSGGLNTSDSVFALQPSQASGGRNYDYHRIGGIRKRKGYAKINTSADTQLNTLGLGLRNTTSGTRTLIRAAGTKLQNVDVAVPSFTNMTADTTAASSDVFTSASTEQVLFKNFNTSTNNILWFTGGGSNYINGAYSTTKFTQNGSSVATGSFSAVVSLTGGSFTVGTYFYAISLRKASSQAESNATLDVTAVIANTTDKVTINFSGLTSLDTTKYDKILLYRSAVGGVTGFTTGALVATLNSTTVSYVDTGTSEVSSTNVPREDSGILDNTVLPSGSYHTIASWKRRLVTASESNLYISDFNKPESWPTENYITIPSGGPITGLAVIAFNTPTNSTPDELLVIFKETEIWIVTGDDLDTWILKFTSNQGCVTQSLVIESDGYLAWMDRRGVYLWDGAGKPIYASQAIEDRFGDDGDIDFSTFTRGFGVFSKPENLLYWTIPSKVYGSNKYTVKLDLRLTYPTIGQNLNDRVADAVFIEDSHDSFFGGINAKLPNQVADWFIVGDDSGFLYHRNYTDSDIAAGTPFYYKTKHHDLGSPGLAKRYHKVVVWVEELGTWDLTLTYWTDYRTADAEGSTLSTAISAGGQENVGVWDVGFWEDVSPANNADTMYWDGYSPKPRGIVFNLSDSNSEGDAILLQFSQIVAENPVTIFGYSILYTELSIRK